jgi:hypothetical protein
MIKNIIEHFAIEHGFELINNETNLENHNERLSYLIQYDGDKKRFLALFVSETIISPQELNDLVNKNSPESFKLDPAFERNTDLIILHQLDHRADFKMIENEVFNIEENPYYFKKYFLYFSKAELALLANQDFNSLTQVVTNVREFSQYRENPLIPSLYSIAARIFIKVPFLKVPVKEGNLKPIKIYLDDALIEKDVHELYEGILNKKNNDESPEEIVRSLINEAMENS